MATTKVSKTIFDKKNLMERICCVFGSPMDERTFWSERYRIGFNTQEMVDEVYGKGILNTVLFWEYDMSL